MMILNKLKQKKRIVLLLTCIMLAVVIGVLFFKKYHHETKHVSHKNNVIPVRVLVLKTQTLPIQVSASGYLKAIKSTSITPRVSGYINHIPVKAGDNISVGQPLFQLDDAKEKEALVAAKANDALSQMQYQRDKQLLKKGFITEEQYYSAQVAMKENAATLQSAKTNLSYKTISAPFSGTLGSIAVSTGNYVTPGQQLSTLVNTDELRVTYTLPVNNLSRIHLKQPVSISSDASQANITGYVSFISPSIDQDTQTITLHARVNNQQHEFKPGEYVNIRQHIGTNDHALLIPEQSVLGVMNGYSVFIAKNHHAIQTAVKIGNHYHGLVAITSGLKANDQVIIAGQNQLHDGQAISIERKKSTA